MKLICTFAINLEKVMILTAEQIRECEKLTMEQEPILSIDLMERAAFALFKQYALTFHCNEPILVMAGPGNNGGDALALAKRLLTAGLDVKKYCYFIPENYQPIVKKN